MNIVGPVPKPSRASVRRLQAIGAVGPRHQWRPWRLLPDLDCAGQFRERKRVRDIEAWLSNPFHADDVDRLRALLAMVLIMTTQPTPFE